MRNSNKLRSITATRLGEKERSEIESDNRSIAITIPRADANAIPRAKIFKAIPKFVADRCAGKGLVSCSPSGNSLHLATFDTTANRNAAIPRLEKDTFTLQGISYPIKFGEFGKNTGVPIWRVPLGPTGTPEQLRAGIVALFRQKDRTTPNFAIRPCLVNGVLNCTYSIRFESAPRWLGKQVTVGQLTRLITQEGGRCACCSGREHNSWDCKVDSGNRLFCLGGIVLSHPNTKKRDAKKAKKAQKDATRKDTQPLPNKGRKGKGNQSED